MAEQEKRKSPWTPVLIFLMAAPPIAFLIAIPFLREQPDNIVFLITGAASFLVVSTSVALTILKERRADEWTRSGGRFSTYWGYIGGAGFIALLLNIPAFRDFIATTATAMKGAPVDDTLVQMAFTAGFMASVLAQMVFILIFSLFWRIWMSRPV